MAKENKKLMSNSMVLTNEGKKRYAYFYDDGSVAVDCARCLKTDTLESGDVWAVRLNTIENSWHTYLCFECWKSSKDTKRQEDIHWGESWKLATMIIHPDPSKENQTKEDRRREIEDWQKWFYEKLSSRNQKVEKIRKEK